jgi:NADPH-dependent 2,4-dienoyl-CoA reductase/sulfur reductase-like enzyme
VIRVDRRSLIKAAAASAAAAVFPKPSIAQGAPRVAIVGGGFGGVNCARALRKISPRIAVTLIEANPVYTAPPNSNTVLAGLSDLRSHQFAYDAIMAIGVDVVFAPLAGVDHAKRMLLLGNNQTLQFDRLVVSPGIAFQPDALEGYDEAAMAVMPPAFTSNDEIAILRRQLEAMTDGDSVIITVPVNPARCPPAPYERASLIAHYLKSKKPRSKVIVLDAKESFTMQKLFQTAWKELYPGLIEWVGLSDGGAPTRVDVKTRTVSTDFDKFTGGVVNIIPPQRAGDAAKVAGVADRTGWCPVDPLTFESTLQKGVHVIGDAAIAGAMPRSASAAQSQGAICAAAIAVLLAGQKPATPVLRSSCFSLIAPGYAISQRGSYRPVDGQYVEAEPVTISAADATLSDRAREATEADDWFHRITRETFG